jgi:hypothetical protein
VGAEESTIIQSAWRRHCCRNVIRSRLWIRIFSELLATVFFKTMMDNGGYVRRNFFHGNKLSSYVPSPEEKEKNVVKSFTKKKEFSQGQKIKKTASIHHLMFK